MKTLRLSTIVLLLASVFFSCTKDTLSSQDSLAAANKLGLLNENGNGNGNGGGGGNTDVDPALTIVFMDGQTPVATGVKDEEITVIGKFNMPVADQPTCGKLQLQKRRYDGTWETVIQVEVTSTVKQVQYSFTPDIADPNPNTAAYDFQLHYVKQGCEGFSTTMSQIVPLHVTAPCPISAFGIEGKAVGMPVEGEEGMYAITVTFTISSPEAMENVHFQGGATSGGQDKHALEITSLKGGLRVLHDNKQNTVLVWENGSLLDCGTKELSFTYKRRFRCAEDAGRAVTGEWTLTGGGLAEPYVVAPVTYDCVSAPAQ